MKPNPTRSALLVIDMENGFVHPEGGHWIRFAQSMVPNCVRAVELARAKGIPVFFAAPPPPVPTAPRHRRACAPSPGTTPSSSPGGAPFSRRSWT